MKASSTSVRSPRRRARRSGSIGDVPTELAPGTYRITFLKQRVTDVISEELVPGGTPRTNSNRTDIFAACEITLEVTATSDISVAVVP